MIKQLSDHIAGLVPSFKDEVKKVAGYFEHRRYSKDETVIAEHDPVDTFYFVIKGCLHLYYTDGAGKQNTIHFAMENWWITEYNAFLGNSAARFGITALENAEVMVITKKQLDRLLLDFPFMGVYFNAIHMKAYGASLLKQKTFATVSKKDFYTYFTSHYPEFVSRVPHPVLASYIGISTEELAFFIEQQVRS